MMAAYLVGMLLTTTGVSATVGLGGQPVSLQKRTTATSTCSAGHMQAALGLSQFCAPRDTVVPVPWSNISTSEQVTPTHVTLKRCDGSCGQHGHSCQPQVTRLVQVPVILAKCGIRSGICDKECTSLQMEEHQECTCRCHLTSESCRSDQDFQPELCSCQCRDILAKQQCLDSGRFWDDLSCTCTCDGMDPIACPSGLVFDNGATCSCIPDPGKPAKTTELAVEGEEGQPRYTDTQGLPSVELVIIASLLGIILILLVLVFSLVVRVHKLRRLVRLHSFGDAAAASSSSSTSATPPKGVKGASLTASESLGLVRGSPDGSGEDLGSRHHLHQQQQQQQHNNHQHHSGLYSEVNCSTPSSGFYSEMAGSNSSEASSAGCGLYGRTAGVYSPSSSSSSSSTAHLYHQTAAAPPPPHSASSTNSSLYQQRVDTRVVLQGDQQQKQLQQQPAYQTVAVYPAGQQQQQQPAYQTVAVYPAAHHRPTPPPPSSSSSFRRELVQMADPSCLTAMAVEDHLDDDDPLYHSAESVRNNKGGSRGANGGPAASGTTLAGNCCALPLEISTPLLMRSNHLSAGPMGRPGQFRPNDSLLQCARVPDHILHQRDGGGGGGGSPPTADLELYDVSNYEAASHHIDEALRLLQESAEQL